MANWYYFNENGNRVGPVTSRELKGLAANGTITPGTAIETEDGKTVLAKKIKGLVFADASKPESALGLREMHVVAPSDTSEVYGLSSLPSLSAPVKPTPPLAPVPVVKMPLPVPESAVPELATEPTAMTLDDLYVGEPDANEIPAAPSPFVPAPSVTPCHFTQKTPVAESPFVGTPSGASNPFTAPKKPEAPLPADLPASDSPFNATKPETSINQQAPMKTSMPVTEKTEIPLKPILVGVGALLFILVLIGVSNSGSNSFQFTAAEREEIKSFTTVVKDIKAKDADGITMLHYAAADGNLTIVKYLVSKGISVNATDKSGHTPLNAAANKGNFEVAKFLIEKGAKVNPNDHYAPIRGAAYSGSTEIVKLLISKGANVKAKSKDGLTALHEGVGLNNFGNIGIAKLLIEAGADVNAKDLLNETPLDKVHRLDSDMANYLKSVGAKSGK